MALDKKNLPANAGDKSQVGKISWRQAWQCTTVFFPGESHGQRSLVGNSAKGHEELDTIEYTQTSKSQSQLHSQ